MLNSYYSWLLLYYCPRYLYHIFQHHWYPLSMGILYRPDSFHNIQPHICIRIQFVHNNSLLYKSVYKLFFLDNFYRMASAKDLGCKLCHMDTRYHYLHDKVNLPLRPNQNFVIPLSITMLQYLFLIFSFFFPLVFIQWDRAAKLSKVSLYAASMSIIRSV